MASINTVPIFTAIPQWDLAGAVLATANTAKDGTGTVQLVFTADATYGSYCDGIVARALGTNIGTVLRVFINNGSTPTSAANNELISEITLAATTLSEVAALAEYFVPIRRALPPGWRLYCTVGTTVAAGYALSAPGGKYLAAA